MIEIQALSKRFGSFTAVDRLSFSVAPGEVLGFLGPNGAGKSTTMKMISGFLLPSEGTVKLFGRDVVAEPVATKQQIGYLPEGAPSYGEMTVREFLGFIAEVRQIPVAKRTARINEVIGQIQLEAVVHKRIETLSKGFGRRVGLAQAIMHDPQVLILDEPTDGLDPNQKHEVRKLIAGMAKDKIIIVSTHILEEVDAVCSRAIIIAEGRKLADGTPDDLAARAAQHQAVTLVVADDNGVEEALRGLPSSASVSAQGNGRYVILPQSGEDLLPAVSAAAQQGGWQVQELYRERGRLDDVFRDITLGASASATAGVQ